MKFFSCIANLSSSWRDVAVALFQRYPNPFSKHVLTEDVLERYVNDEGKLYTVKLLTKTNSMPKWGERLYNGPKFVAVVEESIVDPQSQTFTTYTRNISMSRFMSCVEKCVYTASGEEHSQVEKSSWLDSQMGYGLSIPILEFAIQRYKNNQHKATFGLEYAISHQLPPTLRDKVKQKREHLAETAIHSKEFISQKAKKATELARSKAEHATTKAKAELPKVKSAEV